MVAARKLSGDYLQGIRGNEFTRNTKRINEFKLHRCKLVGLLCVNSQ